MNRKNSLLLISALAVLGLSGISGADDDDHRGRFGKRLPDVAPVTDPLYRQECGGCHFSYQPGLLPARSWKRVMAELDDHFGDNASLGEKEHDEILVYLLKNSADDAPHKRSRRIVSSLGSSQTPLRISDAPYLAREHREIPRGAIGPDAKVTSISQCQACHRSAEKGDFSERNIDIPGFGPWRD